MNPEEYARIREILEKTFCYVLYDPVTRVPLASSGSEYDTVPQGLNQVKIPFLDHEELIQGTKRYDQCYIYFDDNNQASVRSTGTLNSISSKNIKLLPNTIQDLNPQRPFFDFLGIQYFVDGDSILLDYEKNQFDEEVDRYFRNS